MGLRAVRTIYEIRPWVTNKKNFRSLEDFGSLILPKFAGLMSADATNEVAPYLFSSLFFSLGGGFFLLPALFFLESLASLASSIA